jgi:hypothetical protein
MLERLTASSFAGRVGEQFGVTLDDRSILELELVSVAPGPPLTSEAESRRIPFSVVFRGPVEPILPQRIYPLENQDLGAFELFIVPIGPDQTGMQYEAVFG